MTKICCRNFPNAVKSLALLCTTLTLGTSAFSLSARPSLADSEPQSSTQVQGVSLRASTNQSSYRPGEAVQFTLTASNYGTKPVTLTFPSGQRFDFTVTPQGNGTTPVWQWSMGRMFAQRISEVTLRPGERQSWSVGWNQVSNSGQTLPAGTYTVQARLATMRRGPQLVTEPMSFRLGAKAPEPSPKVGVRGTVLRIDRRTTDTDTPAVRGYLLVKGPRTTDTLVDYARVAVMRNTAMTVPFGRLRVGDVVEVTFSGPVAESYPVQASARTITLLKRS